MWIFRKDSNALEAFKDFVEVRIWAVAQGVGFTNVSR
jgi:hypothetical protein